MDGFGDLNKLARDIDRADVILTKYEADTGSQKLVDEDESTALVDLLTDLRHWCTTNEVDFDHAVEQSESHWAGEQPTIGDFPDPGAGAHGQGKA